MTNAEIIEGYKILNKIDCPLHTYAHWKAMGYQVKKGEKSKHPICIWKQGKSKPKTAEVAEGEEVKANNIMFMKIAYFFTIEQVERITIT